MRLGFKAIKNQGKLLKIGQFILLLFLLGILYIQLSNFDWNYFQWNWPKNGYAFIFAVFCVVPNWYFEWLKWSYIAGRIRLDSPRHVQRGFYAGMLSGFLTPSALGNFLGRMTEVEKKLRPKVVSFTLFSNAAQFLTSLKFGVVSLFLVNKLPISILSWKLPMLLSLFAGVILYFTMHKIPLFRVWILQKTRSISDITATDKFVFILYSTFRYLVFSFQFFLFLVAFQPDLSIEIWFWVWVLYLLTTISPSLLMGKLFIRETLAIFVLTFGGVEMPIAFLASLLIWFVNNAVPSIFAYFMWKRNVVVKV